MGIISPSNWSLNNGVSQPPNNQNITMNNLQTLTLPAPAKVNRFLHVLNRRPDGYHNLQTAFQFVGLCDEISFRKREDSSIHLISPLQTVTTHDNLIVKAAQLLQQHTGCNAGIDISLKKIYPWAQA